MHLHLDGISQWSYGSKTFIQSRSLNGLSKTIQKKVELVVGKVTEPTRENTQLFPSQSETLKRGNDCEDEISGKKPRRRRITYPELRVNAGTVVKPFVLNIRQSYAVTVCRLWSNCLKDRAAIL